MAVFGRVPALLPDVLPPQAEANPRTSEAVQRVREIAIETMVQATAQTKTKRALQTRTLPAGQLVD